MNIEKLVNAVYTRKSRRRYLNEPLKQEQLDRLTGFINSIEVPFEHNIEISIHRVPEGLSCFYFKEPGFIAAFKASERLIDQAKAGFIGELFILYAESIEIGTCWYGHYRKEDTYKTVYNLSEEDAPKKILCITPLGYVTEKMTGISDMITGKFFSSKKNSISQNLHKQSLKEFPDYIRKALELSCLAPSAMNSQCWYFKVDTDGERYTVEISKPEGYRHFKWPYTDMDVGTAACHFWIGLKNQGVDCSIKIEELDRAVWKFII